MKVYVASIAYTAWNAGMGLVTFVGSLDEINAQLAEFQQDLEINHNDQMQEIHETHLTHIDSYSEEVTTRNVKSRQVFVISDITVDE